MKSWRLQSWLTEITIGWFTTFDTTVWGGWWFRSFLSENTCIRQSIYGTTLWEVSHVCGLGPGVRVDTGVVIYETVTPGKGDHAVIQILAQEWIGVENNFPVKQFST